MRRILITLLLVLVCIACGQVATKIATEESSSASAQTFVAKKQTKNCTTFRFYWLEIENVLYSPIVRHIEIFLDEKAFSEENLKTLFAYLSEKNPEPKHLTVVVHTNWKQLWFPSDCPPTAISEQPDPPDKYDYLQATYHRRKDVEYFDYSQTVKIHAAEFKRVYIRNKQTPPKE